MDWGQLILGLLGLGVLSGFIPIVLLVLVMVLIGKVAKAIAKAAKNVTRPAPKVETFMERTKRLESLASRDELEDES